MTTNKKLNISKELPVFGKELASLTDKSINLLLLSKSSFSKKGFFVFVLITDDVSK
jgi:hypothetical protein